MKVKITAHAGYLVIDTEKPKEPAGGWVPIDSGKIGSLIADTKTQLGLSAEACALLKKIPAGTDGIGTVMWFRADEGQHVFGWMGHPRWIIRADRAEGDKDFAFREGAYVLIPNDLPIGLDKLLDDLSGEDEQSAVEGIQAWLDAA